MDLLPRNSIPKKEKLTTNYRAIQVFNLVAQCISQLIRSLHLSVEVCPAHITDLFVIHCLNFYQFALFRLLTLDLIYDPNIVVR